MDMTTLKQTIIDLKESGMTFQEVADTLERKYGIVKTRQAISGLYKRAKDNLRDNAEHQRLICDIVNLYCICDSAVQVVNELQHLGVNVSYRQVLHVISKEEKYLESVKRTIIANLSEQIIGLTDIREAVKSIEYKGILISRVKFEEYFQVACEYNIRQDILLKLSKMYKLTSNKTMVKSIASKFNINLTTSDLK